MKFCEKLIILRKRRGLTQEEFAREVGVSRQSVYKWESGKSYPEAAKLMEIRRLYGISVDELLDESEALLLAEEKKSEHPALDVPPAPAPIYEEKPAPVSVNNHSYTPIPASPRTESKETREESIPHPNPKTPESEAVRPSAVARPRVSVSEPPRHPKKKKQTTLFDLVGSIFGRKR